MAATRPRYCGVLLVAALWLTAGPVCPDGRLAAQKAKHTPPLPPFASLFPLEEAWMITLPAPPSAPAAYDGAHLFVPLSSGQVVALDWQHGDTLWSVASKVSSAPVVAQGTIYVASEGQLHALDAMTGAVRWSARAPAPVSLVVLAGARVLGVGATIAAAFDATSGAPSWTRPLDDAGEPVGAAATADALFLTFAKGATRRLALADGQIAWTHMVDGRPSPPLVVEESVYVGDTANRFHALDAKKGEARWSWRTGGDVIGAAADASPKPKAVYYASLDAVVRAVNPGNGHQRWKRDSGTRAVAPPLALDGSVVVPGLSPTLSGFVPLTGAPQGTFDLPGEGELSGAPIISPTLTPRAVAVAIVLKDGRAYGLRALSLMFNESAPQPLTALPGKPLTRERLP